jgi:hypothetical protein
VETLWTPANKPYAERHTWNFQGTLFGSGNTTLELQRSCEVQQALLAAALRRQFQDLVLLDDGGAPARSLPNATSTTGVKVRGPWFPNGNGAQFAGYLDFAFEATAEYAIAGGQRFLLAFEETVTFEGGGREWAHLQPVNDLPQKQLIYQATPYRATQEGSATGVGGYPFVPPPLWPGARKRENPRRSFKSAENTGRTYKGFAVTWAWEYESATPIFGGPTQWPRE